MQPRDLRKGVRRGSVHGEDESRRMAQIHSRKPCKPPTGSLHGTPAPQPPGPGRARISKGESSIQALTAFLQCLPAPAPGQIADEGSMYARKGPALAASQEPVDVACDRPLQSCSRLLPTSKAQPALVGLPRICSPIHETYFGFYAPAPCRVEETAVNQTPFHAKSASNPKT